MPDNTKISVLEMLDKQLRRHTEDAALHPAYDLVIELVVISTADLFSNVPWRQRQALQFLEGEGCRRLVCPVLQLEQQWILDQVRKVVRYARTHNCRVFWRPDAPETCAPRLAEVDDSPTCYSPVAAGIQPWSCTY